MSRSTASYNTSWALPFVLGASSALSLVWLHHQKIGKTINNQTVPSSTTTKRATATATTRNVPSTSTPSSSSEQQLMDASDLDHRMLRKAEAVIQWRTTRLVLVIERCTNDHNYSAILRTAEALGIQKIYVIDPLPEDDEEEKDNQNWQKKQQVNNSTPQELKAREEHHLFARNATEWITVVDFQTAEECVSQLRKEGYQLWVTDLSQEAQCLTMTSPKVPEKVALVMGTEAVGCSQYMLDQADLRVYLPLRGFADSLNLSVATALIIHQLFVMDPTLIGGITETEKQDLRRAWYTKLCQQRIFTQRQKKTRHKLLANLKKCERIVERQEKNPNLKLQATEQKRMDEWDSYKEELQELEQLIDPAVVQAAVEDWVNNPPQPLTDVRRADDHRICYVGKNTKNFHQDHWKDMAATANPQSVHGSTASVFREKVKQASS
jgi:tRNA G18 (ribose-2'-O)-methylase SpoU